VSLESQPIEQTFLIIKSTIEINYIDILDWAHHTINQNVKAVIMICLRPTRKELVYIYFCFVFLYKKSLTLHELMPPHNCRNGNWQTGKYMVVKI
jgi:hypothetical protein